MVAHFREPVVVHEEGGGLEVGATLGLLCDPRAEAGRVEAAVGKIAREIVDRLGLVEASRRDDQTHGVRALVVGALAREATVLLEFEEFELLHILAGLREEDHHDRGRALEGGELEVVLHVLGAEEAELDDLAEGVAHFAEGGGDVAFVQGGDIRGLADGLEAAQDEGRRGGEHMDGVEDVGTAE